jgi:putative transposase
VNALALQQFPEQLQRGVLVSALLNQHVEHFAFVVDGAHRYIRRPRIDIRHETVRLWWNRFGPVFAAEIRKKRVDRMRPHTQWRWHLDEVYVKINGEMHYLQRAVDHEGEVLESFASKTRNKAAALAFIKRAMRRHGRPQAVVTDGLRSYGAAMKEIGNADRQEVGRWLNNRAENSHQPFRRRERAMERFRRM